VRGPDYLPELFGALLYGPAPGVELIPYFLGLLGWMGLALAAIFLAPITALLRRLRRARKTPPGSDTGAPNGAPVSRSPDPTNRDSA
jgi:hypothetical protein